jgi:regulator of sigma D
VNSPLYSKSVNRWKNYEKEFKGVKKLLDRWVNEFGYKV